MLAEQKAGGYSTKYRFTGKEVDEETGLYYFGARYYDPRISLWYGVDPLAEKAPSWNSYRYGFNNPIRMIDPTGMKEEDGILPEVEVTATRIPKKGENKNTPQVNCETCNKPSINSNLKQAVNNTSENLKYSDQFEAFAGSLQLGLVSQRKSTSIDLKIGTFSSFKYKYSALKFGRNLIGVIGYLGDAASVTSDVMSYKNKEISGYRLGFRTTGTALSFGTTIGIGSMYGGAWGAIGGAAVSTTFMGSEMLYDGTKYIGNEISKLNANWESALRSGWMPR